MHETSWHGSLMCGLNVCPARDRPSNWRIFGNHTFTGKKIASFMLKSCIAPCERSFQRHVCHLKLSHFANRSLLSTSNKCYEIIKANELYDKKLFSLLSMMGLINSTKMPLKSILKCMIRVRCNACFAGVLWRIARIQSERNCLWAYQRYGGTWLGT